MKQSSLADRARSQGVRRPYDILSRMQFEVRKQVADSLGWRLEPNSPNAALESWKILNKDRKGLQARTHRFIQIFSPFARNNDWWEILTCTAKRHNLPYDPGMRDVDLERLIFDHVANQMVDQLSRNEVEEIDKLIEESAGLVHALSTMNLDLNAMRIVFKGILRTPPLPDPGEKASRPRDIGTRINRCLGAPFWGPSVTRGIRFLSKQMASVAEAWRETFFQKPIYGRNRQRVLSAISLIYLQDLIDASLEEFESVRL